MKSRLKTFLYLLPGLPLFPLLSSTLPGPSASEVTTSWCYTNMLNHSTENPAHAGHGFYLQHRQTDSHTHACHVVITGTFGCYRPPHLISLGVFSVILWILLLSSQPPSSTQIHRYHLYRLRSSQILPKVYTRTNAIVLYTIWS